MLTVLVKEKKKNHVDNRKLEKKVSSLSEIEMMKEIFSKLLLEDNYWNLIVLVFVVKFFFDGPTKLNDPFELVKVGTGRGRIGPPWSSAEEFLFHDG